MQKLLLPTLAVAAACFTYAGAAPSPQVPVQGGETQRIISTAKANQPPVCCIGPACQHVGLVMVKKCEGNTTSFDLDASGSYDPEGQPLTFQWTACAGSVISNPTSPITTVTLDTSTNCAQICGVRLKVSDGELKAYCRVYVESVADEVICGAKPSAIEWMYTGLDCSSSSYAQDPAGVTCVGNPMATDPVRIVVTHNTQPSRVYFDGIVPLGGTFVELGSAGHQNGKVPPNTQISIFDLAGNLLQTSVFHTSCSQPLEVGDQFGAAIITGYTP